MDQLTARIDSHIDDIQARIQAIQERFGPPIQAAFPAVLTTVQQPGIPLAPPPADSAFPAPESSGFSGLGEFGDIIQDASAQYGVDPLLIQSIIHQESGGNPDALSGAGAMGLMQLMPSTARNLRVDNPYDPGQNVMGGTRYLKGLLDEFGGSIPLALAAYNAGPNAVKRYGGNIPPFSETQNYVRNILDQYHRLRSRKETLSFPSEVQ